MTVSFFLKVNLHWLNRLGAVSNRQRPSCQLVNLLNWSMIACTGSLKMWLRVLGHFILSKITPNKIHSLIDSSRNIRRWSSLSQAAWEFKSPWNEPKYLKQVQGYITYVTPYRNTRVKSEKNCHQIWWITKFSDVFGEYLSEKRQTIEAFKKSYHSFSIYLIGTLTSSIIAQFSSNCCILFYNALICVGLQTSVLDLDIS